VSRHPFDSLVELETDQIRLDCAALHLARDQYPYLNVSHYLRQLDNLADEVGERRPGLAAPARYEAMCDVLASEHGLTGRGTDSYDPQNSYLNRVLDRHRGTPVTLSIIWIEVARRLKWPVSGVGLPGHFLVRFDDPERFVLADPSADGRSLTIDDCRRIVATRAERPRKLTRKLLLPVDTRVILARMLRNLRGVYLARSSWRQLAIVLRRLAALEPRNGKHLQDLAAVYAQLGDVRGAYAYLHAYLHRAPHANDHDLVQHNLERLEAAIVALN
jgi:regulator of sirC expression with transglutaminase-like and TPR domain